MWGGVLFPFLSTIVHSWRKMRPNVINKIETAKKGHFQLVQVEERNSIFETVKLPFYLFIYRFSQFQTDLIQNHTNNGVCHLSKNS